MADDVDSGISVSISISTTITSAGVETDEYFRVDDPHKQQLMMIPVVLKSSIDRRMEVDSCRDIVVSITVASATNVVGTVKVFRVVAPTELAADVDSGGVEGTV